MAYNLPGISRELNFTPEAIAGIFLGKITKWNDPELSKANPGAKLPGSDIIVVHRIRRQRHDLRFRGLPFQSQ